MGNDRQVVRTLISLAEANRLLDLHEEGVEQVKEGMEIFERLSNSVGQTRALRSLARLLYEGTQLNAAEEAAFRAINLSPG